MQKVNYFDFLPNLSKIEISVNVRNFRILVHLPLVNRGNIYA